MAIKSGGTVVIDDSRNVINVSGIQFPDATVQLEPAGSQPAFTLNTDSGLEINNVNNINIIDGNAQYTIKSTSRLFEKVATVGSLQKTYARSPESSINFFGENVFTYGNYAVVASPYTLNEVSVYDIIRGTLLYTLTNSDSASFFGSAVCCSHNYLIVGAPGSYNTTGKVYVYDVANGKLLFIISDPDTVTGGFFGSSVAVYKNELVVGAFGASVSRQYVYHYNLLTKSLIRYISNPNPFGTTTGDEFSHSVSINQNYIFASSPYEDATGKSDIGKVFVFDKATGGLSYTLTSPSAGAYDYFGKSICASPNGRYVVVGAPNATNAVSVATGVAYLYDLTNLVSGPVVIQDVDAYASVITPSFGWSVYMTDNYIVVGAPLESLDNATGDIAAGRAYLYDLTGNIITVIKNPATAATNIDYFAECVCMSDAYIIISCKGSGSDDQGNAYLFAAKDLTNLDKLIELAA